MKQKQDDGQLEKKKQLVGIKIYDGNNSIDCLNDKVEQIFKKLQQIYEEMNNSKKRERGREVPKLEDYSWRFNIQLKNNIF